MKAAVPPATRGPSRLTPGPSIAWTTPRRACAPGFGAADGILGAILIAVAVMIFASNPIGDFTGTLEANGIDTSSNCWPKPI